MIPSVFTADDGNLPDFGRRVDESAFINHVEFTFGAYEQLS